jgi:hypothetical protein
VVWWQWRTRFSVPQHRAELAAPALDRPGLAKATFAALLLLVLFATPLPLIEGVLLVAGYLLVSRRLATRTMLGLVDWHLLVLFGGLFVVTAAFARTGLPDAAGGTIRLKLLKLGAKVTCLGAADQGGDRLGLSVSHRVRARPSAARALDRATAHPRGPLITGVRPLFPSAAPAAGPATPQDASILIAARLESARSAPPCPYPALHPATDPQRSTTAPNYPPQLSPP